MKKKEQSSAIDVIKEVQQYPYDPSINRRGLSYQARVALTRSVRKGTCTTKHEVLAEDLQNIGLDIVYLTFPFFWQNIPVTYPEEIRSLLEMMPQQNHLALGLLTNETQKIVDVTWDPALAGSGFVVPKIGEEIVDMPLAVIPFANPVTHRTVGERTRYLQRLWEQTPNYSEIGLFYIALNTWLISLRNNQ